eukprot:TRINITY_DN2910_c0_g1_i2.p1 TRINITY_DN2910_c0_g1~~TRINITY_DN2910_c0_g1_i2.p1  ORF type:complete len:186 (+),score=53.53 TRINITY_DN2910_c0_g1_i2:351-908(+)
MAEQAEKAAAKVAEDKQKAAAKLTEDMLKKEKQLAEPERQEAVGGIARIEEIANTPDEQKYSMASQSMRQSLQQLDQPEKSHNDETVSDISTSASPTIRTKEDVLPGSDPKALQQRSPLRKFLNALAGSLLVIEGGILMQKLPYFSSSGTQWPQPLRRWTQSNLAVHVITSGIAALMLFAAPRDV